MNENEMDLSLSKMLVYGMGASIETPWGVIFFLSPWFPIVLIHVETVKF